MIGGALKLASNVLNPDTELSDTKSMRSELQSTMVDISSDLKSLDIGIDNLKSIATESYEILVDLKYKEGLDLIDSNYDVFLKGLKNYGRAHNQFSGFLVELQTKANLSFRSQNIIELLSKVQQTRGLARAKHLHSLKKGARRFSKQKWCHWIGDELFFTRLEFQNFWQPQFAIKNQ